MTVVVTRHPVNDPRFEQDGYAAIPRLIEDTTCETLNLAYPV